MDVEVGGLLRRFAALVVVAVACPVTFFGGALVGCAEGLTRSCASDGIFLVSPVLLAGVGLGASFLARGWTGLGFVILGVVVGMLAIPVVASVAGNPVPIDPVVGVIATTWFLLPVLIGHGVGRIVTRLRARSRGTGGPGPG